MSMKFIAVLGALSMAMCGQAAASTYELSLVDGTSSDPVVSFGLKDTISHTNGETYQFSPINPVGFVWATPWVDFIGGSVILLGEGNSNGVFAQSSAPFFSVSAAGVMTFLSSVVSDPGVTTITLTNTAGGIDHGTDVLTITAVPEPSTWAMMLIGAVGLGFAAHRRSRHKSLVAVCAA